MSGLEILVTIVPSRAQCWSVLWNQGRLRAQIRSAKYGTDHGSFAPTSPISALCSRSNCVVIKVPCIADLTHALRFEFTAPMSSARYTFLKSNQRHIDLANAQHSACCFSHWLGKMATENLGHCFFSSGAHTWLCLFRLTRLHCSSRRSTCTTA